MFGLLVAPLGFLMLAFGLVGTFVSGFGSALRAFGLAFWLLGFGGLTAERLRVWPFAGVDGHRSPAENGLVGGPA